MDLLPLDEARHRLRVVGQSYLGVREIPVERIIDSLDRTADFDRSFRPRRGFSRGRLASLRGAFPDGRMPPIEVQELGGAYFVADGHHRVALATTSPGGATRCPPARRSPPTGTTPSTAPAWRP